MITTFIISAVLATVLIGVNPRNSSLRWLSASLYAGSFMIFVFIIDLKYSEAPHLLINTMFFIADVALAFTFGMFGVVYSDLVSRKKRIILMTVGLALIILVWMLTPLSPTRRINYEGFNELPIVLLVTLFLTMSAMVLIVANAKEKHPYKKIERFLTNLLIVPTLFCIMGSYIFYIFDIDLFRFNYILAVGFLILFLTLGTKQGVLGVKIKIEMLKVDTSLHVLKGGASLLNHTIKNEMGKIDILLHQLKHSIHAHSKSGTPPDLELEEMITLAAASIHHMQEMMTRINERVQEIVVNLQKEDLLHLTEQSIEAFESTAGDKVTIVRNFKSAPVFLYIDKVHIKEVIYNMLSNAVEAMEGSGLIKVSLLENNKEVVLQIEDSGVGISKEVIRSIFNPFYSTKQKRNHYGLGLFYCHNVITKHNGSIHVESIPGRGSSFNIHLQK